MATMDDQYVVGSQLWAINLRDQHRIVVCSAVFCLLTGLLYILILQASFKQVNDGRGVRAGISVA